MNKYKIITLILKFVVIGIICITALYLIIPTKQYKEKEQSDIVIESNYKLNGTNDSLQWIYKHLKISGVSDDDSDESATDVVFADASSIDYDTFIDKINRNNIVIEGIVEEAHLNERFSRLVSITGAEQTGFIGKTYEDLSNSKEINPKIISLYESINDKKWDFYGPGIVIQRSDAVIVLIKGKDFDKGISVNDGLSSYMYNGYFQVTNGNDTEAEFVIDTNKNGDEKLAKLGITNTFPAMYHLKSTIHEMYYFPGEFYKTEIQAPYSYENIEYIMSNKVLYNKNDNEELFWKWYYPLIETAITNKIEKVEVVERDFDFVIEGDKIYKKTDEGIKTQFFIKGANLGPAIPGRFFTEFPISKDMYLGWITDMANMNLNTIRVYTLLPPEFYEALYEYNQTSEKPLYLLQEIWPEEHPVDGDYLKEEYNNVFKEEIENVVRAVHGDGNISKRDFRAYGLYSFDVSEYLLGYLVGRELEPEEVKETDDKNEGFVYKGEYIYTQEGASPTEGWLAEGCDYTVTVEKELYGYTPLIGIVNWPTLDYLTHDSEWNETGDKSLQFNDSQVVDINNIDVDKNKISGFFGAYHIYPNYPDFMNNDTKYNDYLDSMGQFRYGGYLKEFMEGHKKYPAVVAEYGISTSMYTAHYSPDGYNHGGLTEEKQAEGIIRMSDAIIREGYSGAIIFEWIDEWAKKTWTTEPYMIPYDKNPFWHNAMDPEQNYGIIAYEGVEPVMDVAFDGTDEKSLLSNISSGMNTQYLFLKIQYKNISDMNKSINIAIDTVLKNDGNSEFILELGEEPKLLANPGYNWLEGKYASVRAPLSDYKELIQMTNKENLTKDGAFTEAKYENLSIFNVGDFKIPQNHIQIVGNVMTIRIPFGLLGMSDPSDNKVLSDTTVNIPVLQDQIKTEEYDKIKLTLLEDGFVKTMLISKSKWDLPTYDIRFKDSYKTLKDYFKDIE